MPLQPLTEVEVLRRLNLTDLFLPTGRSNRPGGSYPKTSLTIHETDNPGKGADALAHAKYMDSLAARLRQVSWHYTVDSERVVKHLPTTEAAYHCARQEGNRHSIGIELCVNKDGNYLNTVDRAALLCAYVQKKLGDLPLKQHFDWSGKNCPSRLRRENRWESFQSRVKTLRDLMDW